MAEGPCVSAMTSTAPASATQNSTTAATGGRADARAKLGVERGQDRDADAGGEHDHRVAQGVGHGGLHRRMWCTQDGGGMRAGVKVGVERLGG